MATANAIVGDMLRFVKRQVRFRFDEDISVMEADCPSPVALICGSKFRPERVIFFNNVVLKQITLRDSAKATLIDRHVLAHEVGYLGHLVSPKRVQERDNEIVAEIREASRRVVNGQNIARKDGYQSRHRKVEEMEADFFGLWLLHETEKQFDFKTFIKNFDVVTIQTFENLGNRYGRVEDTSPDTHPPIVQRIVAMEQFWKKLAQPASRRAVARNYFVTAAGAAYIDQQPQSAFWDIAFVAGLTVAGQTAFSTNNDPVDGLLYAAPDAWNTRLDLSVSRFNWVSPWRFEGEVAWSQQRYGTTRTNNGIRNLLETFDVRYINVHPRIMFASLGSRRQRGNTSLGYASPGWFGWSAGVGLNARLPAGLRYESFVTPGGAADRYTLQPSFNLRVSVGAEWLQKTLAARNIRFLVSYKPQRIKIAANPAPDVLLHNIDCTVQYSFLHR